MNLAAAPFATSILFAGSLTAIPVVSMLLIIAGLYCTLHAPRPGSQAPGFS